MNCSKCPLKEECDYAVERIVEYYGKGLRTRVLGILRHFCPLVPGGDIKALFQEEVDNYLEI